MGVIAEAARHMLAAGMDHDKVIEAIAGMEAALAPARDMVAERKRAADRDRLRAKRDIARQSRDSSDNCDVAADRDPSPKQRVSPTPPSETQPSTIPPSPPKGGSSPTPTEPDEVELAVEAYNAAAAETGWSKVQRLTAQRRSQTRRRLAECGGIEGWRAAMARARGSPFLTGDNDRGWIASFDFFLQAKSFTKLMEGAYDRRDSTPGAPSRSARGPSGAGKIVSQMADLVLGSSEPGFPPAPAGSRQLDQGAEIYGPGDVLPFGRPSGSGFR